MWSSSGDRERAAFDARKLSPAKQREKGEREVCFNAGFDAAVRALTPKQVPVNYQHPTYLDDRHRLFESFDADRELRRRNDGPTS